MSILGNSVARREDPTFLTSGGTYVADVPVENETHLVYVRSIASHARILSVDVDEARSAPGVVGVFAPDDIAELGRAPHVLPIFPEPMRRPFLADGVVRYLGQPIAAVVAATFAEAVDAAGRVVVDYDIL